MRLATSKSDGLYITCVLCKKEEFILNPDAISVDKRDYTCSQECNDKYYKELEQELHNHDEYCDLCNPDIARYEEEMEQINQIHKDKYNEHNMD
tara:strand:+ start:1516 stop:1797 length:282 start_codon:yes stop_codon:yes gene_type:complete